jgi:hypothetical protein
MSVNTILTNSTQPAQPAATTSGQNKGSYTDWLASLGAATGSTTSPLSDQMQALLTQLQAGNTIAPSAATTGASAVSAAAGTNPATPHGHHHHHAPVSGSSSSSSSSDNGSGLGMLQDIAVNLVGNSASASGSGSDTLFGSSTGLVGGLQSLGNTAATGVGAAIKAYAAIHGVALPQTSALV